VGQLRFVAIGPSSRLDSYLSQNSRAHTQAVFNQPGNTAAPQRHQKPHRTRQKRQHWPQPQPLRKRGQTHSRRRRRHDPLPQPHAIEPHHRYPRHHRCSHQKRSTRIVGVPYDGWHSNGYFHYGAFRQQVPHSIYNQSATYQTIH
jgi:hypothetical protein